MAHVLDAATTVLAALILLMAPIGIWLHIKARARRKRDLEEIQRLAEEQNRLASVRGEAGGGGMR